MKGTSYQFGLLATAILFSQCLCAQAWRFPDCNDLIVTKIDFSSENSEKVLVTVFNNCDTCRTHVYTGIILYLNEDTLAIDEDLYSKPSPPNRGYFEYVLSKLSDFEITEKVRTEIVGLCDSIPDSDAVVKIEEFAVLAELEVDIYPNPFQNMITFEIASFINMEEVKVTNVSGQTLLWRAGNFEQVDLSALGRGFFIVEIYTDHGTIRKRMLKNY